MHRSSVFCPIGPAHNPGIQATVTSGLRPPVPGPDADRWASSSRARKRHHDSMPSPANGFVLACTVGIAATRIVSRRTRNSPHTIRTHSGPCSLFLCLADRGPEEEPWSESPLPA